MPDTCGGGGLASCYGSGTGLVNMGRSGTSSQSSSINRLNNSGFSNNRDSSSFYSDCERNSFCSSMSDEAISPADAKQVSHATPTTKDQTNDPHITPPLSPHQNNLTKTRHAPSHTKHIANF